MNTGSPSIGAPSMVSMPPAAMRKARLRYNQQRSNSIRRQIPWQIGFPDWLAAWWESNHWFERGKRKGQWVMSRPGDQGAYEPSNIAIVPHAVNIAEGPIGAGKPRSVEFCAKMRENWKRHGAAIKRAAVQARIGSKHSPESRAQMSASQFSRRARERAAREAAP